MPDNFPEAMSSSDRRLFTKRRRRRKATTAQSDQRTTTVKRQSSVGKLHLLPLLLLLLFVDPPTVFPSSVPSAGNCPPWVNDEIQQCVQPVADFAKTLNKEQQQTEEETASSEPSPEFGKALQWPTKMGGQVFRELCRLINDFEQCVDVFRQKCRRHITISLIEASYGFLCNEGYDTFMASAECLMELDQKPNVKRCHDKTLKSIETANNDGGGAMGTKLDKMCSALNYFSECVRIPIRQNCGTEAWQVIFRVLKDTTRTLMPKCEFEERNEAKEKGEIKQNEETDRDKEGEERSGTNERERVREKGERRQKGEKDKEGEGRERENEGRQIKTGGRDEAVQTYGRKEVANGGRGNAMARQNAKPTQRTTTNALDDWERWEEEENGEGGDQAEQRQLQQMNSDDDDDKLHHQIHYGAQPSRNSATTTKAVPMARKSCPPHPSLFWPLFPFLLSQLIFSLFISFFTKNNNN